jgi:hypothetical protein
MAQVTLLYSLAELYSYDLGDIPGWLTHKVGTTVSKSENPRVSFAFNIKGYWQDTMPLS